MPPLRPLAAGTIAFALCACASAPPDLLPSSVTAQTTDGVQRVEIHAGSYWFRPDHVTVRAGVPVRLTLRKEPGLTPHDFVLVAREAGIDIEKDLAATPIVVEFTPTRAGRYEFHCSRGIVQAHRDLGMTGVLEVLP